MVTEKQIVAGVMEYADKRVLPKLDGTKQFLAGMALGIAGGKAEHVTRALAQMPLIAALDVVRENGEVDLDTLYAAACAQMAKQQALPIDIPVLGRLTFDKGDLDELYQTICRQ